MITQIEVPLAAAVLEGTCTCGITFGVVESLEGLERHEFRPRFCPFCAARMIYHRKQPTWVEEGDDAPLPA